MRIACLAWGSLVWNPNGLPVREAWSVDGPVLPVEFARRSLDGRITLVTDARGTEVATLWSAFELGDLDAAVRALARRERVATERVDRDIGVWRRGADRGLPRADRIAVWACERELDAVVWTALPPRHPVAPEAEGRWPSVEDVVSYLRNLRGEVRSRAEEYVRRAPPQTRTAYRERIERELDWAPLEA